MNSLFGVHWKRFLQFAETIDSATLGLKECKECGFAFSCKVCVEKFGSEMSRVNCLRCRDRTLVAHPMNTSARSGCQLCRPDLETSANIAIVKKIRDTLLPLEQKMCDDVDSIQAVQTVCQISSRNYAMYILQWNSGIVCVKQPVFIQREITAAVKASKILRAKIDEYMAPGSAFMKKTKKSFENGVRAQETQKDTKTTSPDEAPKKKRKTKQ